MTIYILNYNNYYNRLVKKEDSLAGYIPYVIYTQAGRNFNPNDGVNTVTDPREMVIGSPDNPYDGSGNYFLAVNEDGTISSRWFIIETQRQRGGQWTLILRRDVIADYFNIISNSEMFIEKAMLPASDLGIYNSENMTYNQIKREQIHLKDQSQCPWLVGYIPRDFTETGAVKIASEAYVSGVADYEVDNLQQYPYYSLLQQDSYDPSSLKMTTFVLIKAKLIRQNAPTAEAWIAPAFNEAGTYIDTWTDTYTPINPSYGIDTSTLVQGLYAPYVWQNSTGGDIGPAVVSKYTSSVATQIAKNGATLLNLKPATVTVPEEERGKIIYDKSTNKYYRVELEQTGTVTQTVSYGTTSNSYFKLLSDNLTRSYTSSGKNYSITGDVNLTSFITRLTYTGTIGRLVPLTVNVEATVDNTRFHLDDNPYDMFFIPFADDISLVEVVNGQETFVATTNKSSAMAIASSISAKLGSGKIFDLQLLPYCPVPSLIVGDKKINIAGRNPTYIRETVEGGTGSVMNVMLWAIRSSFTVENIDVSYTQQTDPVEKKVKSETLLYRLCSPNYQGLFDFNPEKNGGFDGITVKCTYLPFSPFIQVAPKFNPGYLYGGEFNDARGLTCQGDFSLPQLIDQWANYQQNNKSYQAAFARDVSHMEITNNAQREQERWSVAAGVFSGTASGAISGAMLSGGNPYAAISGGVVGGVTSLAGGLRDIELNELLRNEAIDYKKDQFGYALQNIQAMPQSISKASPLTIVNQVYPTLEIYSATPVEERALRNKIKYNGMTVMRIGVIDQFLTDDYSYIKGQLIRAEDFSEDYHLLNAIASELSKGAFFKK